MKYDGIFKKKVADDKNDAMHDRDFVKYIRPRDSSSNPVAIFLDKSEYRNPYRPD